jgi:hypothetical protein
MIGTHEKMMVDGNPAVLMDTDARFPPTSTGATPLEGEQGDPW